MKKLIALSLITVAVFSAYHEGLDSSVNQYQSLPPIEDNLSKSKVKYNATFKEDGTQQLSHTSGW